MYKLLYLIEGRILHGAGIVVDTDTNLTMMVVTGGLGTSDQYNLDSTEILINGQWKQGKCSYILSNLIKVD